MRHDLRAACDSGLRYPYFLDLQVAGTYDVNTRRMDSVQFARWLTERVRNYPAESRRLVVRMNLSRTAELPWILESARQADVTVYEFQPGDSVCYPPIS
jgi:hypothetical protein